MTSLAQEDYEYQQAVRSDYYSEVDHGGDTLDTLRGEADAIEASELEAFAAVQALCDDKGFCIQSLLYNLADDQGYDLELRSDDTEVELDDNATF